MSRWDWNGNSTRSNSTDDDRWGGNRTNNRWDDWDINGQSPWTNFTGWEDWRDDYDLTPERGLSIAIIGLLSSKHVLSSNWFWAWNFFAELIAVVCLTLTIVSVGSGFYPMTGGRNTYWRASMGVVTIYGVLALINLIYYTYQKLVPHPFSGEEVLALRQAIVEKRLYNPWELYTQRKTEKIQRLIPNIDTRWEGAEDWRQLSWAELEMFARPETSYYLAHQFAMLLTCAWAVIYLFIPLVRHHRHGPVGRPVDSDMMAVGVWYLSCLMTLAFAYGCLNMVYAFNQEFIYEQQAQALDLCLRITLGPIFFLPAPAFLLRFYRNHFRKFRGSRGGSSSERTGAAGHNMGSGNNHFNGSFTNSSNYNSFSQNGPSYPMSAESTRVGSRLGVDDGKLLQGSSEIASEVHAKHQEPTSPAHAFGRHRIFQSRDRGLSVESSRVLTKDFDSESAQSQNPSEDRPDSFHLYYSKVDALNHPLSNSLNLDDYHQATIERYGPSDNDTRPYDVNAPQIPKPVLTQAYMRPTRSKSPIAAARSDTKFVPKSPAQSKEEVESPFDRSAKREGSPSSDRPVSLMDPTGTTGWEVGGYESRRQGDAKGISSELEGGQKSEKEGFAQDPQLPPNSSFQGLTGLQRQLAEHRSALLPQVIAFKAYHEELAATEPFDHGFKSLNIVPFEPEATVPRAIAADDFDSQRLYSHCTSNDGVLPGSVYSSAKSAHSGDQEPEMPSSTHKVDTMHWSMPQTLSKQKAEKEGGTYNVNATAASSAANGKQRDNKCKEGLVAVFSKAITGGSHGSSNAGHKGGQSKSSSHVRLGQDFRDRSFKNGGSNGAEGSSNTMSKAPVAATVEQLAQRSVQRHEELEGEVTRGPNAYDYSDPYDDAARFKRLQDYPTKNIPNGPQNAYNRLDSSMSKAEAKASSTSVATKGTSTQSLGSSKSRDSLAKSNASSKDSQARPVSPSSKKSKYSSRSGSKSESVYRESSDSPRSPSIEYAGTTTRHTPAIPSPATPTIPSPMVKTSLSPPPRQSWRRSKSFKGTSGPITAIDTNLANQPEAAGSDPLSSASATNTSFSSQNSPTMHADGACPISHPSSPNPQQGQGYRGNSLEYNEPRVSKERERIIPLSPPLSGLNSRLNSSRNHRSIDNMSSAYYYKRAAELNNNSSPISMYTDAKSSGYTSPQSSRQIRDPTNITLPSSLHSSASMSPTLGSPPSPSARTMSGLNSYFLSKNQDVHGRNTPSPTYHGGGGSSSTTMSKISSHMGPTFSELAPAENGGQILTTYPVQSQRGVIEDDPWTQAMVNRAQAQTKTSDRPESPSYNGSYPRPSIVARTASE
ncbi:hypothetical protein BG011_004486 [Mortierella polycephala]|uniref:Uncharacterized protein n=1 Tax=Mortierella polycephala TaxID=41804 RepID=A0A9P6PZY1_9FUNG|nr:hypothetical protein BG011_004486 [Mortierella polycephala]